MIPSSFPPKEEIARLSARMLLEVGAVHFNAAEPYTHASGKQAPTYIDCRRLISYPRIRATLMDFLSVTVMREAGFEAFDNVAGGETAGIPFAAWIAERLSLPMIYVRKEAKKVGRQAQIEGLLEAGQRVLLMEDLVTDGGSKLNFIRALRAAGARIEHCLVVFNYGVFQEADDLLKTEGVTLHWLATWDDVVTEAQRAAFFDQETLDSVRRYLVDPAGWSAAAQAKRQETDGG